MLPNNQECRFYCFDNLEAVIVLGLGFCCSLEEYRVIHARPYEGCYMIPNNEVVDSYIVHSCYYHRSIICVYGFFFFFFSHSSTKEQKHGTEIFHELNHTFWWNIVNRNYKDIKKLDLSAIVFSTLVLIVHTINDETNIVNTIKNLLKIPTGWRLNSFHNKTWTSCLEDHPTQIHLVAVRRN